MNDNSFSVNLKKRPGSIQNLFGFLMTFLVVICLLAALIPLFLVLGFIIFKGGGLINTCLFTQLPPPPGMADGCFGLGNAIVGTIIVVGIATIISVPIGIGSAVYLSEFSGDNQIAKGVRFCTNVLSGVPSIIAGIFAYGLLIATRVVDFSAIAGGVALSILMLPTIIKTTDESLKIVPQDVRWAALGVGAYNYQTVLKVVLPAALPGIITGITLAIARAAGETAPMIFTALNSNFWPDSLTDPISTLSVTVYNFATQPYESLNQLAWAGSFILVFMVLITSILSRLATRQKNT